VTLPCPASIFASCVVTSPSSCELPCTVKVLSSVTAWWIMRTAILPNVLAPIVILATLLFPVAILAAASLSFLGLGAQPPSPEWGSLLVAGRTFITTAPWLINFPGLAIFITVLGFNLFGNAVRDAMDPRLRQR